MSERRAAFVTSCASSFTELIAVLRRSNGTAWRLLTAHKKSLRAVSTALSSASTITASPLKPPMSGSRHGSRRRKPVPLQEPLTERHKAHLMRFVPMMLKPTLLPSSSLPLQRQMKPH